MRSHKRVNTRGRKPSGGNGDSANASGKNSGGTKLGGARINRDPSSGMQRHRSPRRLN